MGRLYSGRYSALKNVCFKIKAVPAQSNLKGTSLVFSFILVSLILLISCTFASKEKSRELNYELTVIKFKKNSYDFGTIPLGKSVSVVFEFSNTGQSPLIIKDVKSSCGCTVTQWSKGIIRPNAGGSVRVVYDGKNPGKFDKSIEIISNSKNSPFLLTIKGRIPYPKIASKHSKY